MGQVLIVSNRLPISVEKVAGKLVYSTSLGGVATGLSSYVRKRGNSWLGWPGIANEKLTEADRQAITKELKKHRCTPVFLTKRQVDGYYNGYSNRVLWPLFHNLPFKENPTDVERWWSVYRSVNALFAEAALSLAGPNTIIWVHDYQLMVLPGLLEAQHGGHIGFFLHIPFPAARTFAHVKQSRQLLLGVLGADLVGLHTDGYARDFLQSCQKLGIGVVGDKSVILPTRTIEVTKFPIGVDYEKYAQAGKMKDVKQAIRDYRKRYGRQRKIIVAVDRLEPSKGLAERLKAYRDFLITNPEMHGKVVFVMVAAPSRTEIKAYQNLAKRLEKLTADINQQFGTDRWQPVDLIKGLPFEGVTALYQLADVAYIAPLRDGMNLVAKEYIASKRKNGVLILSQTAGAAEELQDALIVDPKQPATAVAALQQALHMPRRELKRRLRNMQRQIAGNTIQAWAGNFVKTLQRPVPGTRPRTQSLRGAALIRLISRYRLAHKRLLLLDYDGSLVPYHEDYRRAKPPKSLLTLLAKLAADRANEVVIVSGRRMPELTQWLEPLPLNFVAEHGAVILSSRAKQPQTIESADAGWKHDLLPVLEKYSALTPGATIEVKPHSLVWHYRSASAYHAQKYAVAIKRATRPLLKKYALGLYQGNKILEIKSPRVTKGQAVQHWLKRPPDFIVAIGDDYTDEELFTGITSLGANTIKVGPGRTAARYRLKTSNNVIDLLEEFARIQVTNKSS